MSRLQITNLDKIKSQLQKQVSEQILTKVIKEAFENITPQVKNLFMDLIKETRAWRGLLGENIDDVENDVQAILGVRDDEVEAALLDIEDIVRDALIIKNIQSRRGGSFSSIKNATTLSFTIQTSTISEDLLNTPNGSYISDGQLGQEIPWLRWLIEGGSIGGYDIVFEFYDIVSGRDFNTISRTGRAIMLPFGSWSVDEYNKWADSGINFLEDVFENPVFEEKLTDLLNKEVSRLLRTKSYKVK